MGNGEMNINFDITLKTILTSALSGLLLLTGCVSTPQSRVDENPDLFAKFTAEQKETILKGEVDLGFTPEMVMLSAGVPDRKAKKRSSKGTFEVWTYFKYSPRSIHGYGGYGRYYSYSPYYRGYYRNSYWGDHVVVERHGEREKDLVVEFQDGEIVSFEMVQ